MAMEPQPNVSLGFRPPVQQDPLETFGKFQSVANAMENNKLLQNQQLMQQQTMAAAGMRQARDALIGRLNEAMAGKPVTPQMLAEDATMLAATGALPPQVRDAFIQSIPGDPAQIPAFLQRHFFALNAAQGSQNSALFGERATINQGDTQRVITVNPNPGAATRGVWDLPGGQIPNTLTPGEKSDRVGVVGPNGQPGTLPKAAVADRYGNPVDPAVFGNGRGAPSGGTAPPAALPPASGAAPAAGSGNPPGFIATGLPPGAAAPMEASGKLLADDRARAGNFAERVKPLEYAASLLATADTGRASEAVNNIKGFFAAQAPEVLKAMGIDPSKVTDYDKAAKYLAQYAANSPGFQNSDMGREMAIVANANTKMDNKAARQVVMNALGMERMRYAAQKTYTGPADGYAKYLADWSGKFDPRGFSLDSMDPEQKASVWASVNGDPTKKKMLLDAYRASHGQIR